MIHSLQDKFKQNWPLLLLFFITIVLFVTNYQPDTFLTGGDNLHPEFAFDDNIKRSIFAVWQEYQGLGLLGGMGHASDLIRQLILLVLSPILPDSLLRYVWTFSMLFVGSIGTYILIKTVIPTTNDLPAGRQDQRPIATLGALFYLLNLAAVQTFYVPFEAFIAHFGFLPWILLASIRYFQLASRKNLFFLIIVLLLATPASYIPTLFVVYLLALGIVLGMMMLFKRQKVLWTNGLKLLFFIIAVNAFWLFPFLYFTFTDAKVTLTAKINQMATVEVMLRNKEFGNIADVILLRGFWFNNVEPDREGNYTYMLAPWRDHLANPAIAAVGFAFFAVVLFGAIVAIRKKEPILVSLFLLFLFAFTMLSTSTPPFSWANTLFRKIPLFEQAFRFPFTKFSILASLTYSIFFALGVQTIISYVKYRKLLLHISYFIIVISLALFALPAFRGHLFYERTRLTIPSDYFALFHFFKDQDPSTRIANFPQHTFWGWNFNRWGYSGSGFLWYGIKQPILDRAFDVWSNEDENYYFELANSIHAQNPQLLANIFEKYQISWLLVDKSIINPPAPQALLIPKLEQMLVELPNVKKEASFGNLIVYGVQLAEKPKDFMYLSDTLPTVNTYTWGQQDKAFADYGNYISAKSPIDYFYPFRALFSGKTQKDIAFTLQEKADTLEFTTTIQKNTHESLLNLPSFAEKEHIVAADIVVRTKALGTIEVYVRMKTPQVYLGNEKIWGEEREELLFTTTQNATYPLTLTVNGIVNVLIDDNDSSQEKSFQTTFLTLKEDNVFTIKDKNETTSQAKRINIGTFASTPFFNEQTISIPPQQSDTTFRILIPKISDEYISLEMHGNQLNNLVNCDNFRKGTISSEKNENRLKLIAKNASACLSLYGQQLPHQEGYAIFIESENEKGRGLHFWVLNETNTSTSLDTYLPSAGKENTATFILPPQDPFGRAYSLHFDNVSIGKEETVNSLGKIALYPIPYQFISSMSINNQTFQSKTQKNQTLLETSHPNESLYIAYVPPSTTVSTLILSQAFDPGWKAYEIKIKDQRSKIKDILVLTFPFFFGKEINDHVLVNNWENGWLVGGQDASEGPMKIVIVYLPQYLEYIGFILLGVMIVVLSFGIFGRKVSS